MSIDSYKKGEFSSKEELIKYLNEEVLNYNGIIEDDAKLIERYCYELKTSKDILEKQLNKQIDYLCWPGGGYNSVSLQVAENSGYTASTIASKDNKSKFDNSLKYKRISRFGLNSVSQNNGKYTFQSDKKYVVKKFLAATGHPFYKRSFLLKHYSKKILNILFS